MATCSCTTSSFPDRSKAPVNAPWGVTAICTKEARSNAELADVIVTYGDVKGITILSTYETDAYDLLDETWLCNGYFIISGIKHVHVSRSNGIT